MTHDSISQVSVDGLSIAYVWQGQSNLDTPLLFLHGLGDSSIMTFDRIASHPSLARQSSILIDLPGFGYSSVPETWSATIESCADIVIAVCRELSFSRIAIVGHSMGGSVAIQVAATSPGLVSQLIVAEPLLTPEQSILGASITKYPEDTFVEQGFAILQRATRRQACRGNRAARSFREPLTRAQPRIMHRCAISLLEPRSPTFYELLVALDIPRSLLTGEQTGWHHDRLGPHGVITHVIPDAGHSMMSENPDALAHAIKNALIG